MARPAKQTVDYFPHLVKGGKTLFILENAYGNDGYAFWFKLLEILASSEGHFYDCSSIYAWDYLAAYTKISGEKAAEILDKLVEIEAIDKELWQEKIIWVQHLVDNVTDAYKNRKALLPQKPVSSSRNPSADEFLPRKLEQTGVSSIGNPQRREEETKEEESKREESKAEEREGESSATSAEFSKVIESFNQNIHPVTPVEAEKLQDWLKDMESDVVILAIGEAATYSKRSMGYINAVLNSWLSQGIKTKQAAESYLRDRADEKVNPTKKNVKFKAPVNSFNSYDQRGYTPEQLKDLEKKLLGRDGEDDG